MAFNDKLRVSEDKQTTDGVSLVNAQGGLGMAQFRVERLAYSQVDAATLLGVSLSTIRRLISAGELRTIRVGKRRAVIPRAELERLLSSFVQNERLSGSPPRRSHT